MFPAVAAISVPANVAAGSVITNPRRVTGAWEQRSALGRTVGFDVEISTQVQGAPKSLTGLTQRVAQIRITTYVRTQGHSQRTFWSSGYDPHFSWRKNHLVLREPAGAPNAKPVVLDVVFDPQSDTWRGMLQNEWFSGPVDLRRPSVPLTGSSMFGNWMAGSARQGGFACLHLASGADGALVIWSDEIELPGFIVYGQNGTVPPSSAYEWYGGLDMDPEMKFIGSNVLFFAGTDMSGDVVLGHVSADGTVFTGSSAHFGNGPSNGAFNPFTWHRGNRECAAPT